MRILILEASGYTGKFLKEYLTNKADEVYGTYRTENAEYYRVTFSGRVQNVGFRLEVCELAKRLGLTGYCKKMVMFWRNCKAPIIRYSI